LACGATLTNFEEFFCGSEVAGALFAVEFSGLLELVGTEAFPLTVGGLFLGWGCILLVELCVVFAGDCLAASGFIGSTGILWLLIGAALWWGVNSRSPKSSSEATSTSNVSQIIILAVIINTNKLFFWGWHSTYVGWLSTYRIGR